MYKHPQELNYLLMYLVKISGVNNWYSPPELTVFENYKCNICLKDIFIISNDIIDLDLANKECIEHGMKHLEEKKLFVFI